MNTVRLLDFLRGWDTDAALKLMFETDATVERSGTSGTDAEI